MGVLTTPVTTMVSAHGGTGSITGPVDDAAGADAEREVRVTIRATGQIIRKTRSVGGSYTVANLKKGLVVDVRAMHEGAGTVYNDLIHSGVVVS